LSGGGGGADAVDGSGRADGSGDGGIGSDGSSSIVSRISSLGMSKEASASLCRASLRHIGRVDSNLNFLASLASTLAGLGGGSDGASGRKEVEQRNSESVDKSCKVSPPRAIGTVARQAPVVAWAGVWVLDCDNETALDNFYAEMGYGWYLRQLTNRVLAKVSLTTEHTEEMGDVLVLSGVGKFMGNTLLDVSSRIRPHFFPKEATLKRAPGQSTGPTYQLDAIRRNQKIGKLADRLINARVTRAESDGRCITDLLYFDPKAFLREGQSIQQIFNPQGLDEWFAHLQEGPDEHGLPKAMQKGQWIRRTLEYVIEKEEGEGSDGEADCVTLREKSCCYEYDATSDDWSRLRTSVSLTYIQSPAEPVAVE
jgi:hypothetical protein